MANNVARENGLAAAYQGAEAEITPMRAQIAANAQMDMSDHTEIHESSRSPFAIIFSWIQFGNIPYTKFSTSDPEWREYLIASAIPAIIVLIAGILICLWLLCKLCCVKPKAREGKPSTRHIRWTSCVGFFLLWIAVGFCVGRGSYGYDLIYRALLDLQPDVNSIANRIDRLQPGFHNAAIYLDEWQESCIGWKALEPALGKTIDNVNKEYVSQVAKVAGILYELRQNIYWIPDAVEDGKWALNWFISEYKVIIGLIVFAPTVLASIVVVFIVWATVCEGRNPQMARITNFLVLDLGAVPIITIILIMTIISAGFMFAGVAIGGFCENPQHNTVNIVSATQGGTRNGNITQLVGYFVEGHPENNTIVETLNQVRGIIKPVSSFMWIIAPALNALGLLCHRVGSADLPNLLSMAVPDVEYVLPLASRQRVYTRYNDIVVRGICGQVSGAIGWYMLCQIFSGMVLLPLIAVESHNYLTRMEEDNKLAKSKQQEEETLLTKMEEQASKQIEQKRNLFTCCSRQDGKPSRTVMNTIGLE